MNTAQTIFWN